MSLYRRKDSPSWFVNLRWKGYPRLQLSTGTPNKALARAMERTVHALKGNGRRDLLELLAARRLRLPDVHEAYMRDPAALEQRVHAVASPALGPLVEEWLATRRDPAVLSPKTRRPYAPRTVDRYEDSWHLLFSVLPRGRESTFADLTKGAMLAYRQARKATGTSGATINRDMVAFSGFFRWCEEDQELKFTRPPLGHELENPGRDRWFSAEEFQRFWTALPENWRPFFRLLVGTGMRLGEAVGQPAQPARKAQPAKDGQPAVRARAAIPATVGILWSDVRLAEKRVSVHARHRQNRRLKTRASTRLIPFGETVRAELAAHRVACPGGPADPVFSHPFTYRQAQHVFNRTATAIGLHDVRIHDLRHTFGVWAAQSGVPLPRLQKLMGHTTPAMTMRYMAHAPGAYFDEDADRIEGVMTGATDREAAATRKAVLRVETA
ncbi:MAG TPA: site-specific integrase [Gemmatimonadales bacterium]|nr:site-specific integrase [Gemmatimonadales bacterium]